jgi:hypothetical protein
VDGEFILVRGGYEPNCALDLPAGCLVFVDHAVSREIVCGLTL